MERRDVLKTAGGIGAVTAAGGLGLLALTGSAAAASVTANGAGAKTDDGEIEWAGFGGTISFEWDGLDSEAEYGEIVTETALDSNADGYNNHGAANGPLGDGEGGEFEYSDENSGETWGGVNDENTGTGTEGSFTFRFGSPNGQNDYAIAYDDSDLDPLETDFEHGDAIATTNPWDPSEFEADTDGDSNVTEVTVRVTGRVYGEDPSENDPEPLSEDSDEAGFNIGIENRQNDGGETSGNVTGAVGADES